MKNKFKAFLQLFYIVIIVSSTQLTPSNSSTTYDPTSTAPTSLSQASQMVAVITGYSNSGVGTWTQKPANKPEALAKMLNEHSAARDNTLYGAKSYFNTNDPRVLENIYDSVTGAPEEYIIDKGGKHYLLKDVSASSVGIQDNLGFVSSTDNTPLTKVLLTVAGIKTGKGGWDISNARIMSTYLITQAEYTDLTTNKAQTIIKN